MWFVLEILVFRKVVRLWRIRLPTSNSKFNEEETILRELLIMASNKLGTLTLKSRHLAT
jgi:hypothetical protein